MSGWDIELGGVTAVLTKVYGYIGGESRGLQGGGKGHLGEPDGGPLVKVMQDFGEHVGDAQLAAASSDADPHGTAATTAPSPASFSPISAALAGYAEYAFGGLEAMVSKTSRCVNAAAEAAMAYDNGHLEMARNAQRGIAVNLDHPGSLSSPVPKIRHWRQPGYL